MKNYKFITIVSLIGLASCTSSISKKSTNDVYILVDNTEIIPESRESLVNTESILKLIQNGGNVTWQNINSVSINSNQTIEVSFPDDPTNLQKRRVLEPFKDKFNAMKINFLGPVKTDTDNSSIYKPVCTALHKLNESKSKEKTLVIISDMVENSQYANFYRSNQKFESIRDSLARSGVSFPENSSNLKVVILYNPKDQKHEIQHENAMRYWDKLFQDADIKYEIKANF